MTYIFWWTGKFLYKSKTNYKESKLASNLITDTRQGKPLSKSKEAYTLFNKDNFAQVWAALFASLETQLTAVSDWWRVQEILVQMPLILQGTCFEQTKESTLLLKSFSTYMAKASRFFC